MNKQIVFVWVSYGSVNVYRADAQQEMKNVFHEIVECLEDWGMEYEIAKAETYGEIGNWEKAIKHILNEIQIGSHDAFETGTSFQEVVNLS